MCSALHQFLLLAITFYPFSRGIPRAAAAGLCLLGTLGGTFALLWLLNNRFALLKEIPHVSWTDAIVPVLIALMMFSIGLLVSTQKKIRQLEDINRAKTATIQERKKR